MSFNEEWRQSRIGEEIELLYGKGLTKKDRNEGKYPVYGSNGITDDHDDYLIGAPGIIVGRKGTIGKVEFTNKNFWPIDTTYYVNLLNEKNDFKFWYYFLKSFPLEEMNSHSAVPGLNREQVYKLKCLVPTLKEQKAIANILSSLDNKIELNNKMNQTLEQIAQAIYKNWFVDFEPFKDEEFIDSELGKIPEGWEIRKLKDIFTIQNGYAFKSKDYQESGVKVIRTVNIKENNFLDNKKVVFLPDEFKEEKYNKYKFKTFDVVMVMVGASVGEIGIIMDHNLPALQNQNMWRFRSKLEKINQPFVFSTIKSLQEKAKKWATGSARNYLRKGDFGEIKCIVPPEDILSDYNDKVIDIFNKINNNLKENQTLKQLRDTLLSKLMSGEIRVEPEEKGG